MHDDEIPIDAALVRGLIDSQFPHWAALRLAPVHSTGTDNAIYRLGTDMAVRLPRRPGACEQIEKEYRWLPKLAAQLPLEIPVPLRLGAPAENYPYPWSVCCWLDGDTAVTASLTDLHQTAQELARFIKALQRIDAIGGPIPGAHNSGRGEPLALRDAKTREAIASLRGSIDVDAAAAAWDTALQASTWNGPPVWLHGDLLPSNLLVKASKISAVIDFGCLGVGDPACDLMAAWTLLSADARRTFRTALAVDDATWLRGSGWALSFGLIALPYYRHSNPVLATIARRAIEEVLADFRHPIARGRT
jgi:aminoglycoside phosphotransferase (APT) family kinase protein